MQQKLTLDEIGCICLLMFFAMLGYVPILMPTAPVATAGQSTALHGINHLILFAVWSAIFLFLLKVRFRLRLDILSAKAALAYVAFAMLSVLWSSERSSTLSASVSLAISTVFAIYLVSKYPGERLIYLLSRVMMILAIACAVFAVAVPKYGLDHLAHAGAWQGVLAQKNSLGLVMVFGTGISLSLNPVTMLQKLWKFSVLFMCIAEVGLSQSREAWVVCALVLLTHLIFMAYEKFAVNSRTVVLSIGAVAGVIAGATIAALWVYLLKLMGRDATLTGRTILWQAVLEQCRNHPWTGYGLATFWGTGDAFPVYARTAWVPTSAHNGFLECLLELGGIGLFLLVFLVFLCFRNAVRIITSKSNFDSSKAWIYCVLAITCLNMVGNVTGIINSISWMLLVCGACVLEENARSLAPAPARAVSDARLAEELRFAAEVRTQRILNT